MTPEQIALAQSHFAYANAPTPGADAAAFGNAPVPTPTATQNGSGPPLPYDVGTMPPAQNQTVAIGAGGQPGAPPQSAAQGSPAGVPQGSPPATGYPMAQTPAQAPAARGSGGGAGGGVDPYGTKAGQSLELRSMEDAKRAKEEEARAVIEKNDAVSIAQSAAASDQAERDRINAEHYKNVQNMHAGYLSKSQAMLDDLAKQRVDPNRFWANKDTGDRITYAIGGMLGGILQGMGRTSTNTFMDHINGLINRDIEMQKSDINSKDQAVRARGVQFEAMRNQFGDEQLADQHMRLQALETTKQRIDAMAARADNPITQARAAQAVAAVDGDIAKTKLSFSEAAAHAASAAASARTAAAQREFENRLKLRASEQADAKLGIEDKTANAAIIKASKEGKNTFVSTGPGKGYQSRNEITAAKETEGIAAADTAVSKIEQLIAQRQMLGKGGLIAGAAAKGIGYVNPLAGAMLTPNSYGATEALGNSLILDVNKAADSGILDKNNEAIVRSITGDATGISGLNDAKLLELKRHILERKAQYALSNGQNSSGGSSGALAPGEVPPGAIPK